MIDIYATNDSADFLQLRNHLNVIPIAINPLMD